MTMRNAEQNEILGTFLDMLAGPTGDGGNKRAAGTKPHWKEDDSHMDASRRHFERYWGHTYDDESGCHHLIHCAWRLLAVAYQDMVSDGRIPEDPTHEKFRLAREMQQIVGQRSFEEV